MKKNELFNAVRFCVLWVVFVILCCVNIAYAETPLAVTPSHKLTKPLNIYKCPDGGCAITYKVKLDHNARLEVIGDEVPYWYKVKFKVSGVDQTGYVYRRSVSSWQVKLNSLQRLAAENIMLHRHGEAVYMLVADWCYRMPLNSFEELPEGKGGAISLYRFLNVRGGFNSLTSEQKKQCAFDLKRF